MLSLSGVIVPVAHAQSTSDLQAQISALLAQIQQLQAQLSGTTGGTTTACSFTRDLTVGSTGDDVKCMQMFLNSSGYQVAASGAGSSGNESTYFGSLTKAALAKWQAAMSVSPAAGYFGPISRAKYTSVAGTGTGTGTGTVQLPAPVSGLRASLAADNPATGSLISGTTSAARVPVLAVNLTAGTASGVTLNEIKFKKVGVLSDSSISGAYLVENGQVVAQYNSIASGVITFSGLGVNIGAGQTRRFELAIDPATGLSAGNTVGFGLLATGDVMATDAGNNSVTTSGAFPLNGNTFTVTTVSNPSLASMTVASSSIGTEVTAGTNNNLIGAWNFTVTNSKIWLKAIKFKVIGSANKSDVRNVVLKINGTQVGPTLAQVSSGGDAFFDASANPGVLNTGSNNIQVYADVAGSPSFNFQFEILNSYDILAVDSQYNVPIAGTSNTGTQVSIKTGSVTVSQATDTPTGNLAVGQSGVTLAKFTIYAGGEAMRVKWLGVQLAFTGFTDDNIDLTVKNLSLVDDAGGQVGTTINTLTTSVTCTDTLFANVTSTSWTYANCFGNSSSPINYVVPANTTRVLSLRGDIQSTASFTTIQGKLTGNTSNLQGLTSSQTASSAAVSGAALTLASASLTTAKNTALGDQTLATNATGLKIGSYAFSAASAEGVTINNISVTASGTAWSNLKVKVDGVQFGTTQGTVTGGTTYSFSGSPFTVPAGQTKYVEVYADSLSSASGTITPATILSGCTGSGLTSYTAISCTARNGQAITFAGQSTVTIAIDSATPAAKQLVMGSTGNTLGIWRFTETSNVEDIKITDLIVSDTVESTSATGTKSAFGTVGMYNSAGSLLASAGAAITADNSTTTAAYYYKFSFGTPVVVPRAGSISLTMKGDVSSYSSSGAKDNTTHVFKIATSTTSETDTTNEIIVALGATSNASSAISGVGSGLVAVNSNNANAITVLRSRLTVSGAGPTDGVVTNRTRQAVDDMGRITFAADAAGAVQIGSVKITFSGSGPSTTAFFDSNSVDLYDSSTGTSYNKVASDTVSLTYDLSNYTLSAGASKMFVIRLDSTATIDLDTTSAEALAASVQASTDVTWKDALDSGAATGLNLESVAVP
ncbi:MAG: hypothetical protein Q7N50_03385, partial [Armatimonadota bacterium]|nr:hypothetical protein [Armatimonadota bacterium]